MLYKTKRFAYRILLDYYEALEKSLTTDLGVVAYENGCTTIEGVRKVGKTTLLKQLCHSRSDISWYKDCSGITEDFDFGGYYESAINNGIKRIYLDEICKIPQELMADFIAETKYYSGVLLITITGSVRGSVAKISSLIGRGLTIVLPPILYVERLLWAYDTEGVYDDYLDYDFTKVTSYDKFLNYIKRQNISTDNSKLKYIGSVVEDTLQSYTKRTICEGIPIDTDRFYEILKYISLCQHLYKNEKGQFADIPSMRKVTKALIPNYKELSVKYKASNQEIVDVCKVLYFSGLARSVSALNLESLKDVTGIDLVPLSRVDDTVPAMVFEYPWFSSFAVTESLINEESLVDLWLEMAYMARMSYIYRFVDKYRSNNILEMDLVYTTGNSSQKLSGFEVKNRKSTNVSNVTMVGYQQIKDTLKLEDVCLSCTDSVFTLRNGFNFYRCDLIAIALELEYCNRCRIELKPVDITNVFVDGGLYCGQSISELVRKYKLQ